MLRKVVGAAKNPTWGKLWPNCEGPLSYHLQSWHWSIFFRGSGRIYNTMSLECKQPEEVLLLISIYLINLCVLYIKCLYCSSFGPFKCLNFNSMGWLTLVLNSFKCLHLNSIMPVVLEPDDLGWLTLVLSAFKCLNLNSIMLGVLRLYDLVLLTLVLSAFKCLNLNSIMPRVIGPDDLGWLALILSSF